MRPTSAVLALAAAVTLLLGAIDVERSGPVESAVVEPVDFVNDLIPVFTRSGCNAGGCHGAAIGCQP